VGWTVGQVARLAGVSVRTLHHYDEIGLVRPADRSAAGYRHYAHADLERLQQVLAYRRLGFALEDIAPILDDPAVDTVNLLRERHASLTEQAARLKEIVATVQRTMEAHRMGIRLTPEEMFEVFGDSDPTEHAQEAEERWGETAAYRESRRRTTRYDKHDWQRLKAGGDAAVQAYASAYAEGLPPTSNEAMDAAEANRQYISQWFYECSPEMHRALGDMFVADDRFTAYYDAVAPGLAHYVREAIYANAARQES
jgi:DNA-binding transcriptional MerR regulator